MKNEKTTGSDTDTSANAAPIRTRARGRPRICSEVVEAAPKKRGGARPGAGAPKGNKNGLGNKGGGRPLKFGEKSKSIFIRFSKSDAEKIEILSKNNNKNISAFVRDIVLEKVKDFS